MNEKINDYKRRVKYESVIKPGDSSAFLKIYTFSKTDLEEFASGITCTVTNGYGFAQKNFYFEIGKTLNILIILVFTVVLKQIGCHFFLLIGK